MSRRPRRKKLPANAYSRVAVQLTENPGWIPVIAEGDSWFSFPGLLWRRNIVGHLQQSFEARMAALLVSHNGDRVTDIVNGKQNRKLRRALGHRFNFRILLFSAGGNDIVDDIDNILLQKSAGVGWRDCIDDDALDAVLTKIRRSYMKLIHIRDEQNPSCHIFTHCYDFPSVNGQPIRILGKPVAKPPLKPAFVAKGITSNRDQRNIIKHAIAAFRDELQNLPVSKKRFTVVDTTGTLNASHWKDEIHPSDRGFGLIARKIGLEIVKRFPGSISVSRLRNF